MKPIHASLLLTLVAAITGCGRASEVTQENAIPTQAPATFPEGIYVANFDGDDSQAGTPAAPVRSINEAIRRAAGENKKDVYVIGGDMNGGYTEVVVLREGVNLHGSVCMPAHPPLTIDRESCLTTISGGTPTLIAEGIRERTVVEDLAIQGNPGVQSGTDSGAYFEVPGVGCIGRGTMDAGLQPCTPAPDAQGRSAPHAAMAVAIADSENVFFRNVAVESATAADGLRGEDGVGGEQGLTGNAGGNAGTRVWESGPGGAAVAPAACPEAAGGNGGRGGRFDWDGETWVHTLTKQTFQYDDTYGWPYYGYRKLVPGTGHSGRSGASAFAATGGGTGKGFEPLAVLGSNGNDGTNGEKGAAGVPGIGGIASLDLSTLVAASGSDGKDGWAGHGGGGAGGGAPAVRTFLEYTNVSGKSSWNVVLVGGSTGGSSETRYDATLGATAAGGGGAGGSGGCGGRGAKGGQGGASSVAVYLVDSQVQFASSTLKSGQGGNGGHGGNGGPGGFGAAGMDGGDGAYLPKDGASGTTKVDASTGYGFYEVSGGYNASFNWSKSESKGGRGGKGGNGGNGGNGGVGGGGAGGASIVLLLKGNSTASTIDGTELVAGEPGVGGGPEEAKGADGIAALRHAI